MINALLRIEPRVRQTSFFFRGPAVFEYSKTKSLMFRFRGDELLPYPAGLAFPQPDFTSSYFASVGATLKPYVWIRAIENVVPSPAFFAAKKVTVPCLRSANRDEFFCSYCIFGSPTGPKVSFSYKNLSQDGAFELHSLAWLGFGNSVEGNSLKGYDVVTFSGFGLWTKNQVTSLEQAAVQIWENPNDPSKPFYVGIQISSGDVSNVDLRPDEADALP